MFDDDAIDEAEEEDRVRLEDGMTNDDRLSLKLGAPSSQDDPGPEKSSYSSSSDDPPAGDLAALLPLPAPPARSCMRGGGLSKLAFSRLKTTRMSVTVTQSCRTGELSKSYADGLPSRVEKAIRREGFGSEADSAHRASCSFARVMAARLLRP